MRIFIIGPGGVGKSKIGFLLSKKLRYDFVDLDSEFCEQIENVGKFIDKEGYKKYATENSKLFYKLLKNSKKIRFLLCLLDF